MLSNGLCRCVCANIPANANGSTMSGAPQMRNHCRESQEVEVVSVCECVFFLCVYVAYFFSSEVVSAVLC